MSKFWQQVMSVWGRLEIAQQATIVLSVIGAIALIAVLSVGATQPSMELLARDLDKAKAAEIATYLEQANVPFKLVDNDTAVLISSKFKSKMLNELSQKEILGPQGKGFELLDKGGFLESTFREHTNYDRAVAGELERSFRELPGVKGARVIIDRPQPSPFVGEDEAKPRASIKLDVSKGTRLSERQIAGIIGLTAGAVAGLDHDRIEVMDNNGLLTPKGADTTAAMAQTTLEAEIAREAHLTRKAQEQLDAVLGPGRGKVKVSVKLDFSKRSESSIDPLKSAATSEKNSSIDKKTPVSTAGGVAGTASNVEDIGRTSSTPPQPATEVNSESMTTYFVGHKKTLNEFEVGTIKGMSVSILLPLQELDVDEVDAKGKPTGKQIKKRQPYGPAESSNFEKLILNSIGFESAKDIVAKQGDMQNLTSRFSSTVQSMALYEAPVDTVAQAGTSLPIPGALADWISYGVVGVVSIALLLVARGQLRRSHKAWLEAETRNQSQHKAPKIEIFEPAEIEDEEKLAMTKARRTELKAKIKKSILENPGAAADVVKRWLHEQA